MRDTPPDVSLVGPGLTTSRGGLRYPLTGHRVADSVDARLRFPLRPDGTRTPQVNHCGVAHRTRTANHGTMSPSY